MRGQAQVFFLVLLCLGKVKLTAACDSECSSLNNLTVTETTIRIQLNNNFTITSVTFQNKSKVDLSENDSISNLYPGIQYIVHFNNPNESCCKYIFTKPSPVHSIHAENITNTTLNLSWKNDDKNASSYTYQIVVDGPGDFVIKSSNKWSELISNLQPGTSYRFKIYPEVDGGKTKGNPNETVVHTKPSPVSRIHANHLNSTSIILTWNNEDINAPTYIYKILKKESDFHSDMFSNTGNITLSHLQPGTLYSFEIAAQINGTNITGDTRKISLNTKPSPVYDIKAENITNTSLDLTWKNNDTNSPSYTYRIQIDGPDHSDNETSNTIYVSIIYLKPGTLYKFKIYAQLDNETEGDPNGINVYTKPSPVYDIKAENITNTSLDLTWKNNDTNASNYIYRIHIDGPSSFNVLSKLTYVPISNLEPGRFYKFKIFAQINGNETEGDPNETTVYTRPSPVYDIEFANVTTTTLEIKWKDNDTNASNYTYQIYISGTNYFENKTSNTPYMHVDGLEPGTLYVFEIYAEIDGNKGDPKDASVYTKPSPVYDIKAENITNTSLDLTWKNNDTNASNYTYRIHMDGPSSFNVLSKLTYVPISNLEPGRLYKFKIFAQINGNETEGDPNETTVYTKPSSVFNIIVEDVSTTMVNISWESPDAARSTYSYRILINGSSDTISPTTSSAISDLNPGTNYQFSIYSIAADNKTEGTPKNKNHCTDPASVDRFDCNLVEKQPQLSLDWSIPNGSYEGFRIEILNNQNKILEKKNQTIVTDLDYFTTYTITIVTLSCKKTSIPQEKKCRTSITDPPPLIISPVVKATSHNSFSVQFNSFNSSHGPITAYAVIITTSEGTVSNEVLKYTYNDFWNKETSTYVAYIKTEEKRSPSTKNQDYVVEIGDESTTYGYFNGKLDPLGSYRACVAAFTRIVFVNETIVNAEESYVSFSHLSPLVGLPQNPAVITGGVVGSILVLLVIVAIVGFIFWKKKRKGRNNEVPFSQIEPKKSKLLKVENYESYFKKQKADSNCGFAEEYEDLRPVGANQPKFAAELSDNKGKNRYNNVLPYDISRVKLSIQNHPTDDYINANYMPGYNSKKEFIAAQGPLPNTVQDFWRMIWEKKIYTVVMLTKCVEQGRTKCEEYWPNKQSKNYGDLMVAMTSEIFLPEWTIRDFSIQQSDSPESHPVRQFHFTAWPDHGVPETTDLLISFRHLVHEFMKQKPQSSPTLVHCSAGVGRTGTFIAIDRLIQQMEMENTVDVYGTVYDLRMHRSLMVQTEDQYVFLNHCVMDIIKSKKEKKMDLIYQNTDAMAIYENFTPSSPYIGRANGYHV
ncbi:receptor-type tyrosine-protein phosphatase eta-like isoform X1 [Notechis scutatus]|uniref:Receptor-type tyrosine-protein phosphatase eta n=1 Tax=Notechis scutatus TaxID=8663 RepID=A0A6J1U012_9SAUR|nr:receptor-type tyrosine-protein phosphatase eta-like isoform X1 [Notechis scutatus]